MAGTIRGSIPLSDAKVQNFFHRLEEARELREASQKRHIEKAVLIFQHFCGCGGDVEYVSEFVPDVPRDQVRLGGNNPLHEELGCVCQSCGKKNWNLHSAIFRDRLYDYRHEFDE